MSAEESRPTPLQGGSQNTTAAIKESSPDINKSPLFDELRSAGMSAEVYEKALARANSDVDYEAALTAEMWEELQCGDEPKPWLPYLTTLINACKLWPTLRDALARKGATFGPCYRDGDGVGAHFRCYQCRKPMHINVWEPSERDTGTFAMFDFDHDELGDAVKCPTGERGDDQWLEWLGLGAFAQDGGTLDLAFLEEEQVGQEDATAWLIPGMFARGDYWSLFGPSEVGKSLLALEWSLRMARNGLRVLYLDRENSREVLGQRLRKMGARRDDFVNLILMPFVDIKDLATEAGAQELHAMVKKHSANVVVLDTISKFSEVGQAVQSDRWQKMYNHSFVPLLSTGVSVGQLDHTGLSDKNRERDSNAKRDNVSVAWALTWRGKDKMTLTRAKNRPNYSSPGSVAVERVDEPFLTHVMGESVPDDIRKALDELERLNVPARAGRPTARAALDAAGVSMADKVLEQAIRVRKQA